MRPIAFAIITLTVLLMLQPCREVRAFSPSGGASVYMTQLSGTDDCEDGDECSPFCICSCCSHLVSYHVPDRAFDVAPVAAAESRSAPFSQRSHPRSFKNTIWQPPKH